MIHSVKLSTINNLLLILIIAISGYVIVAPVLPALQYKFSNQSGQRQRISHSLHATRTPAATPQANQLLVPAMLLQQSILEGPVSTQYKTLDAGIWRWPGSSTPDKGGNTVLIGHRFTYTNPRGVFYHLNKVKIGDEIGVFWNHKKYLYTVTSIAQVPPTATHIQEATADSRLTLFTCTPLWLPKNRLVVVAHLETHP